MIPVSLSQKGTVQDPAVRDALQAIETASNQNAIPDTGTFGLELVAAETQADALTLLGLFVQRSITSGPVTLVDSDQILTLNLASPTTINLPVASTRGGRPLTFKDVGGQSGANNITLVPVETIDGAGSFVLTSNYQSVTLYPFNDGVNSGWFIS